MVTNIRNLSELEGLPVGAVVFYKQGRVLKLQWDGYDIGIVVPSGFPKSVISTLKRGLVNAVNDAYTSPEMEQIRELGKQYHGDWDKPADVATLLEGYDGLPKDKTLVVTSAPVPENGQLAERFALELEDRLRYP